MNSTAARIRLTGQLALGPHLQQFSREATALLSQKPLRGMLLDMSEVVDIDSAGLGELVILYTAAGHAGVAFCLISPARRVTALLKLTRLSDLFPQFADDETAAGWLLSRNSG